MSKRILLVVVLIALVAFVLPNARSLYEGSAYYLIDAVTYRPTQVQPISHAGRFSSIYDLIRLRNQERLAFIRQRLELPGVSTTLIPIPGSPYSDVLARFNSTGPYTIFCAHYDKFYDDVNYQGASDNTAAVSVLLASIAELAARGDGGNRAFLFTGEEETGLRGATAFVDFARVVSPSIAIREVVDLDSLGRDALAIRPSADQPGFFFTLPLIGDIAFDGSVFQRGRAYPPANAQLTQSLLRVQPDIVVLERFTALSDSNVFQANGIDTVAVSSSNMYYLQLAWDTYADQVQLLDERNLERAYELVLNVKP